MIEKVDAPPATVPLLPEKLRQLRIARHRQIQQRFGAPYRREADPTYVILTQLSRGEVRGGKAVGR